MAVEGDGPIKGPEAELLYLAWGVIANVGFMKGGWEDQHPDWIRAAERWRDDWHEWMRQRHDEAT